MNVRWRRKMTLTEMCQYRTTSRQWKIEVSVKVFLKTTNSGKLQEFITVLWSCLRSLSLICLKEKQRSSRPKEKRRNGRSIQTEPLLCCFIPWGLIHWMCKDDGVTIGDQMGLTTGWKCKECLLNWCSPDEEWRSVKTLTSIMVIKRSYYTKLRQQRCTDEK